GDVGDVPLGTSGAEVRAKIEDAVRTLLDAGGRPIALGGDHSITYPIVRAVRWFHPRLSILHFDAHPDLYPELQGDPYPHACALAAGVGHRGPGGLAVRAVLTVLQGLPVPIVGADVVEFNPQQDAGGAGGVTAAVCAKLVKELAGKMIAGA